MQVKITKKLFHDRYSYKVVIICQGAQTLRDRNFNKALTLLKSTDFSNNIKATGRLPKDIHVRHEDEADYLIRLLEQLINMTDYELRIETPWVNIYTNNLDDIDTLIKLDPDNIKYICQPPANTTLSSGKVIMSKVDYEFKVTLGKTTQSYEAFLEWADSNKNVKVSKGCIKELSSPKSWGGKYFYITGKNNLLMAKMHLGGCIAKVESVIKA